MSRLKADYTAYVPPGSAGKLLANGPGLVHAVILSADNFSASETLTLYDNTAASGNVLLELKASAHAAVVIERHELRPLFFRSGLTAVTSAGAYAHVTFET